MVQETEINFVNEKLKIGMASWRKVYLLSPLTPLNVVVHKRSVGIQGFRTWQTIYL
jgi:hypothetical protein